MKMPNSKLVNVLTIADFNAEENIVNIWRLGNKDSKDSLNFVCAATLFVSEGLVVTLQNMLPSEISNSNYRHSGTDFTREKVNFHPSSEISNSFSCC